jgi:hypothetical protein
VRRESAAGRSDQAIGGRKIREIKEKVTEDGRWGMSRITFCGHTEERSDVFIAAGECVPQAQVVTHSSSSQQEVSQGKSPPVKASNSKIRMK